MPRYERKISKSGYYHIMVRGNERKNIFVEDEDREFFIKRLGKKAEETGIEIIAYVLMDNHFHLLINDEGMRISLFMKKVNLSYVLYFNKKYKRIGHLFQDRFKSEEIENDSYLLSCTRYIHRNPYKAKMISGIQKYKWSSYHSYINKDNSIVKTDLILEMLSDYNKDVIAELIDFHKEDGDDEFIEYDELSIIERRELVENKAKKILDNFLKNKSLMINDLKKKENVESRNKIISSIKKNIDISERQISKVMNLDKGIINKVLKCNKRTI